MKNFTAFEIQGIGVQIFHDRHVEVIYPSEIEITLEIAKDIESSIIKVIGAARFYLIVNFENVFGQMPDEVQNFYANEAKSRHQIISAIYVINNLPIRILAKFHIRFFKPTYPVILLASQKDAIDWIEADRIKRSQ